MTRARFSSNEFINAIEGLHATGLTYIEAVLHFSEEKGLEPESAAAMVKRVPALIQKMEAECSRLCLLKEPAPAELPL